MCGIVGLFLKTSKLYPELGLHLSEMLVKMSDRGPDSAGLALYSELTQFDIKLTLRLGGSDANQDFNPSLKKELLREFDLQTRGNHIILHIFQSDFNRALKWLSSLQNSSVIMSTGEAIEIFKEIGEPKDFVESFEINDFQGTHGIGHTRMATESAVTTMGAHPFSTGLDQCLVHNGSLSNHNSVRRKLLGEGMKFETDNDSEVAASYLSYQMSTGYNLRTALSKSLEDLDGFFTFLVGTKKGFGVLRDKIACKPAVLAETSEYVAFGSEYRALSNLPGIEMAKIWEPEPATVYFWEHSNESI